MQAKRERGRMIEIGKRERKKEKRKSERRGKKEK